MVNKFYFFYWACHIQQLVHSIRIFSNFVEKLYLLYLSVRLFVFLVTWLTFISILTISSTLSTLLLCSLSKCQVVIFCCWIPTRSLLLVSWFRGRRRNGWDCSISVTIIHPWTTHLATCSISHFPWLRFICQHLFCFVAPPQSLILS
jgi:hypothetical protein